MDNAKALRIPRELRVELREIADESGKTYSQVIEDTLPSDPGDDDELSHELVQVDVTPECHAQLARLAGDHVAMYEVIQYYLEERGS